MIEALLVGVGGALGAISRYLVGLALGPVEGPVPFETLFVNVVGSFALGWVTFASAGDETLLFVGVGACGAFTTFSSFSVDTIRLAEEGPVLAAGYALSTLLLSAGALVLAALAA